QQGPDNHRTAPASHHDTRSPTRRFAVLTPNAEGVNGQVLVPGGGQEKSPPWVVLESGSAIPCELLGGGAEGGGCGHFERQACSAIRMAEIDGIQGLENRLYASE